MSTGAPTTSSASLTDRQKSALVSLLGDEDPSVHRDVRARILACGQEAVAWLQPHSLSPEPLLRRRVLEILQHLARQQADGDFLAFCVRHGDDLDLEDGIWLLARSQYPDINPDAYRALLDEFAGDIRERLAPDDRTVGCLAIINDQLFNELGFCGNEKQYYDPENSYLNRVIDRRIGNPVTLCVLYWLVARRLQLPVVGISMPRHFLCRYQTPTESVYIDAFNRGKLLTRADCIRFFQQIGHGFQEGHLAPATPGRTLLRICSNLHQIYHELGYHEDAARFQRYLVALAK